MTTPLASPGMLNVMLQGGCNKLNIVKLLWLKMRPSLVFLYLETSVSEQQSDDHPAVQRFELFLIDASLQDFASYS